jgi:hypothetical protein
MQEEKDQRQQQKQTLKKNMQAAEELRTLLEQTGLDDLIQKIHI